MMKVISGGQTGVDLAALKAALDNSVVIGGWCPPGRVNEDGVLAEVYPLQETPRERSPSALHVPRSLRTEWNVRDSDATLLLIPKDYVLDLGTAFTLQCVKENQKPFLKLDPYVPEAKNEINEWIRTLKIDILNIAGPSENNFPGIYEKIYSLLTQLFKIISRTE